MAYYSGTVVDIQRLLRSVHIGMDRLSSLTEDDVTHFQQLADSLINMRLSGNYYIPLRQITVDSVTAYPDPIPYLAQLQTAVLIMESIFSEVEPAMSQVCKDWGVKIDELFNMIINGAAVGSSVLRGQRLIARNRFQNPRIAPKEPTQRMPGT